MKIVLEREKCIGCGTCASLCPQLFEMDSDGKSHIKKSRKKGQDEELEISELSCAKEALEACPAQCLRIV